MTIGCIAPLFVPADRPDRYRGAASSGADAIVIDLEDAVAFHRKEPARRALTTSRALPGKVPVFVRINGATSPWYEDDIACVASLPIFGVVLPKTESASDIVRLVHAMGNRPIIALVETARGLANARTIAPAAVSVRLAFGSLDYCADVGCAHTRDGLLAARSELVLASSLQGLPPPLDGVTADIIDEELSYLDARHAVELGFGGKLCVHPRQITAVRRGFLPDEREIAWARDVLATPDEGAALAKYGMVDAPVRAQARRVLARVQTLDP